MLNLETTILRNWRPAPVYASIEYQRLWAWMAYRLKGREARDILDMLRAMRHMNLNVRDKQQIDIGNWSHFVIDKPFLREPLVAVTEAAISQLVTHGHLVRSLDFAKFPVDAREIESYGHVVVIQLDGIARDSYTVRLPVRDLVTMTRLLLDVAHDDYGLHAEDLETV